MAMTTTFAGAGRSTSTGFVRRAFDRMVDARAKQARRYVNGYLLSLDDATLAAHGFDRAELEREGATSNIF